MFYQKIYNNIITNALKLNRNKKISGCYYENHHIIPVCVGGNNKKDNMVLLTAKEHFLCHYLLTKMYEGKEKIKLIYAFHQMCQISDGQKRYITARGYALARTLWANNHPCKSKEVRDKISNTLKIYFSIEENRLKLSEIMKNSFNTEEYKNKQHIRSLSFIEERICICGCNTVFICSKKSKHKYIEKHKRNSNESNKKQGESLKKTLKLLTKEEMITRLRNSLLNDPVKRGRSISKGKKGKSTKQQQIMGQRYALMTEEVFNEFVKNRKSNMKSRMIRLRQKYV